jgi:hypothetical protein
MSTVDEMRAESDALYARSVSADGYSRDIADHTARYLPVIEAELDALRLLLAETRVELAKHGWGDFHYGSQGQDPAVRAMVERIDAALP